MSDVIDRDELLDAVNDVLDTASSSEAVRAMVDPFDPEALESFRQQVVEVGWTGIDIPEEYGGAGATFADLAVVFSGMGAHLSPGPLLGSAVLGAGAILAGGTYAQRSAWLPALAEGSARVAAAVPEVGQREATLTRDSDDLVLTGTWHHVPDAVGAEALALPAQFDGDDALVLVPGDPAGLAVTAQEMHDRTRQFGTVTAAGVRLPSDALMSTGAQARDALASVVEHGALAIACDSLGIAERVLAITVEYLKQREQFDRLIGSFQSVKHQAADMLIAVETARVIVNEALRGFDEDLPERESLVSMAKSYACDAAAAVAAQGVTLHGGIGFTWEHDTHLYLKRAKLNQALFGSSRMHRRRVADLTLDAALPA